MDYGGEATTYWVIVGRSIWSSAGIGESKGGKGAIPLGLPGTLSLSLSLSSSAENNSRFRRNLFNNTVSQVLGTHASGSRPLPIIHVIQTAGSRNIEEGLLATFTREPRASSCVRPVLDLKRVDRIEGSRSTLEAFLKRFAGIVMTVFACRRFVCLVDEQIVR